MHEGCPRLDVVLPVHNEAGTIEAVVRGLLAELGRYVEPRLVICEDGSVDDTLAILRRLATEAPIHLITSAERKGYARALIEGLRATQTGQVLVLDADGQCDPGDFPSFWSCRGSADIILGWRQSRADSLPRRLASRSFEVLYRTLFHASVHDPSCPYALIRRAAVASLLDRLGLLEFGFWWELVARAQRSSLSVAEVPVHHRPRAAGATRVFTLRKTPGLAISHLVGLAKLWIDTR